MTSISRLLRKAIRPFLSTGMPKIVASCPEVHQRCAGKDAALEFFRVAYYQIGLRNGKFITTNVYGDGNEFVTEEGLWQSFDANNTMFDNGKFLVLWRKTSKVGKCSEIL
jgi:hypothetical protein